MRVVSSGEVIVRLVVLGRRERMRGARRARENLQKATVVGIFLVRVRGESLLEFGSKKCW